MELEKFEEVYQVLEAQKEKDETAAELYADVKEFAYKYATMRYRFSEMSREEKAENDSYRTSQHNRFMDSVRIYFRYLQNNGVNVPAKLPKIFRSASSLLMSGTFTPLFCR